MLRNSLLGRLLILPLLALLLEWPMGAAAQGSVTWSEPFNVSNSLTSSSHPAIVADAYGYVHVFWSEDMNGRTVEPDGLAGSGNTILYRRWDGRTWTEPVAILAVPGDSLADFVAATVDGANYLHLVWTGLSKLYYSSAPAGEAYSPWAWSEPHAFSWDSARSRYESDLAVDSQGTVHIAYAERGTGAAIYHTTLPFGSPAWTTPVRISDYPRANEEAFKDVRLVADASDRLHAVWSTANTNGFDQAVYYARSERSGEVWDLPVLLADATIDTGFTGLPSILAHGQDELLLIHAGENTIGRIERTSIDGGRTWSEPRTVISSMEGLNGFLIPLVDGGGDLHLVINMRTRAEMLNGIFHAPRAGLDWAPIIPVAVEEPYGPSGHYADATVRLGNEVHVVWTQLSGGEIWWVRGEISGVPVAPALVPPTPAPRPLPTTMVTTLTTALPVEPAATRTVALDDTARPPASSLQPLLIGIVPAVLLVLAAALWTRARSR